VCAIDSCPKKHFMSGEVALNTAGYLDVPLPPAAPATLYSRYGEKPMMVLLVLLICALQLTMSQIRVDRSSARP